MNKYSLWKHAMINDPSHVTCNSKIIKLSKLLRKQKRAKTQEWIFWTGKKVEFWDSGVDTVKRRMENNRRGNQLEAWKHEGGCVKVNHSKREKISTLSTPSSCCYGDQLQGQLRGSGGFSVVVSIYVFVRGECLCPLCYDVCTLSWYEFVRACAHAYTCFYVFTHLCCGWGYQSWNLHSRWRSAPRVGCSSPSRHRNTVTMTTTVNKGGRNLLGPKASLSQQLENTQVAECRANIADSRC